MRRNLWLALFLLIATAWSAAQDRIRQPIDSRRVTVLRGVHPMARPEFDQGALDPAQTLQHVILFFQRSAAQQQALDKLLEEQQDPASPNYHNWLTPEQFGQQFGISDRDLQKVDDWLVSQGFTVDEVPPGRAFIAFRGPVGPINSTFRTEMHQYLVDGEVHFANAIAPSVPEALSAVVAGMRSLNDFKPKPRAISRRVKPDLTSGLSGNHFLTPDDFATIYNLNALYAQGIDGTGQKIAVIGQTDIVASDITTFRSVSNLPANQPQVILIPGPDPGIKPGDIGEAMLDLEWSGAVARKATIYYVNAGTSGGVFDSLFFAINNNLAPVISISYGLCEPDESPFISGDESMLQQANAQGQTVVTPAGDNASTDCDNSYPATRGLAVDFPASSPSVIAIGGTTFNEGNGNYWNSVNDSSNGSALYYIPEMVWNDTSSQNGIIGTGGGASTHFAKPSWQTGTGVPNDFHRDVPDIAFNASSSHDSYITCVQGDCQVCFPGAAAAPGAPGNPDANCPNSSSPGYRKSSDQTFDVVGGTSAGVPVFAGMLALLNQKMGSPQGNVNQRLYQLAATAPYVFHDVTFGNNFVPCTAQCPQGAGTVGFSAGVGYDQVTGLGTVDGFNLLANWNAPDAADFGVAFYDPKLSITNGTSTNLLVSVRPQNGFSGLVTLSCSSPLPNVSCSISPTVVQPDATATVSITVAPFGSAVPPSKAPLSPFWISSLGIAAIFGAATSRSKRQIIVLMIVVAVLTISLANCGGASSVRVAQPATRTVRITSHTQAAPAAPTAPSVDLTRPNRGARPAQTPSVVIVQATSGNLSHTAQLPLTIN